MGNLWKVTAKRESGKLSKGMSVEIPISDRSGKPRAKEIAQAIATKYNIEVGETRCTEIYFEIAGEIVERANKEFTGIFNAQLFLSLTDHISYSVERVNKGIVLQNRLIWDIKAFYSKEFTVGLWALTLIKEKIGIQLPEEEASNIAFYLVNAQSSALKMGETILSITMLKEILNIIQYPAVIFLKVYSLELWLICTLFLK